MNRYVFATADDLVPLADKSEWRALLVRCYHIDKARGRVWYP